MSYVDDMKHSIEAMLDQSAQNLLWVAQNGPVIIDQLLNIYLATVPQAAWLVNPIAERAKEELAKAVAVGNNGIALFRKEVQFVGSPDNLRSAADLIDREMAEAARTLARELVLGKIPSAWDSNYSDGIASEGYRMAIDGRDDAVRDVATYAAPVSEALRDLAQEIEDYYKSLRDLAVELAGLIVSIIVLVTMFFTIIDLVSSTLNTTETVKGKLEAEIPTWPAVLT